MAISVVAQTPAAFEAWRQAQLRPAVQPADPAAIAGRAVFVDRCGACHAVRGTEAGGVLGPDLTHLMSRRGLAAGTLPNTIGGLSSWIANPQASKPGARMPATWLPGPDLAATAGYLRTLQ
jgi:cytochrome c oxidase subunit 2